MAEYESSGLNASAFCRQKGMNRLTLETYRLRQGKASGTRHRRRQEADRLAAEYEASGLKRVEFCQLKYLPVKTLGRYVTRYRRQQREIEESQHIGQEQKAAETAEGNVGWRWRCPVPPPLGPTRSQRSGGCACRRAADRSRPWF